MQKLLELGAAPLPLARFKNVPIQVPQIGPKPGGGGGGESNDYNVAF